MFTYRWGRKGESVFEDAFALRIKVFVDEQNFVDEADQLDEVAEHVVVYEGEKPVATGRYVPLENHMMKLGRICVLPEYRGTGLGRIVMEEMERRCVEKGAKRFVLGAQKRAEGFYGTLGYKPDGEPYYEEYCEHIPMAKEVE